MLSNDACVGRSLLTSEVPKDRVMVISLMVGCQRTRAKTGIVQMEKGSVRLVMLMINYVSAERLGRRWRWSWICDTECNRWFTSDVVGHMGCCMDRMCKKLWGGDILSQKWVGRGVPLHPPPLQGSDVPALLMISSEKG